MTPQIPLAPIVLSDSVSLTQGQTKSLNLQKLIAPQQKPMRVRELLFSARIPVSAGDMGGIVRVRLQAGRFAMTNAFVPIWSFAPPYDSYYNVNNCIGQTGALGSGITTTYTIYRWILPNPLYLAPGGGIIAAFTRAADYDASFSAAFNAAAITARLTVIGELLPKWLDDGEEIDVPYASAWVPTVGGVNAQRSGEQDLKNVLDKPVDVQRFVGAVLKLAGGAPSTPQRLYSYSSHGPPNPEIRITDPVAGELGACPFHPSVNWESMFHPHYPAWTIRRTLQPNQHFSAGSDQAPSLATAVGVPMISMVGSRKELV